MKPGSVVAAGHLCLDIFPSFRHLAEGQFGALFKPGRLIDVGAATFSTGGAVSNTGLALHRLGVETYLSAKVGDDPFAEIVRDIVRAYDERLLAGIVVDPAVSTSYTVIISPPGVDRIFLHCVGANEAYTAADLDPALLDRAALLHFGYPTLMRQMVEQGGVELTAIYRRAKASGVSTSLDLSFPDPSSPGGRADWPAIFAAALPYVDIFLPSAEEILFTLRRATFERLQAEAADGDILPLVTPELLHDLSDQLLAMGVKIVGFKVGARGFYLRTGSEQAVAALGRAVPPDAAAWADRELWAPCFKVNVVGTTGAGDATIAGFLAALLRGLTPEEAAIVAVAVGACNVEAADALSGLRSWDETLARIESGWEQRPLALDAPGWEWDAQSHLWIYGG